MKLLAIRCVHRHRHTGEVEFWDPEDGTGMVTVVVRGRKLRPASVQVLSYEEAESVAERLPARSPKRGGGSR
jgi:aspartyl-tRNA synthetase